MMPTPKAFHGCFGRLMRDASDSNDWITVVRSKNKKKVGALRTISNSNRVLKVNFSISKNATINQAVAPKVQTKSLPQGTNHAFASKPSCNAVKKEAIPIKRPKNSLVKSFGAFSEDLKKMTDSKEYLDNGLVKTNHHMSRVKKEISENANLLNLH
jgi:hypothetical protein